MANESLHAQRVLVQLKTVAASNVPTPGDGPVFFGDSSNGGTLTAKLPDGSAIAFEPTGMVITPESGLPVVLGQSYMTDAKLNGAVGDAIKAEATITALGTDATMAEALDASYVGATISIAAAGDGADLITTITAISADGLTVTVADAATDGATDAVVFVGTSDVSALTDANTAATTDGTLLVPPGVYLVDDDLELDAGTIKVMRGASFAVLEGFTLTMTGYVEAAPNQIPLLLHADSAGALERTVPNALTGSGTPESAVVGIIGDVYTDLAGTTDTTLYVKEAGANTDTGWVANEAP